MTVDRDQLGRDPTPLPDDDEAVLAERAFALAAVEPGREPGTPVLAFFVEGSRFALELTRVREVVRRPVLAVIPGAPDTFVGLLSLRGQPVVVADLRPLIGLPTRPMEPPAVVVIDGAPAPLGLAVDDLPRVETVPDRELLPPPPELAGPGGIVAGLAGGCTLLDTDAVLADPRMMAPSGDTAPYRAAAPSPRRKEPA